MVRFFRRTMTIAPTRTSRPPTAPSNPSGKRVDRYALPAIKNATRPRRLGGGCRPWGRRRRRPRLPRGVRCSGSPVTARRDRSDGSAGTSPGPRACESTCPSCCVGRVRRPQAHPLDPTAGCITPAESRRPDALQRDSGIRCRRSGGFQEFCNPAGASGGWFLR